MKKIKVLIVEDSAVVRALLEHIIGRDERLEVCAIAASAEAALHILEKLTPDVIAMDIQLPGMDGLEATRQIMRRNPVPIVVVAASSESKEWKYTAMEALRAGALTILEKPTGSTNGDYETLAGRLCTQLAIMSEVKLVQQRISRDAGPVPAPEPRRLPGGPGSFTALGIVCSTGGPAALAHLLSALGPAFPLPILLVQHMTSAFLAGFASWLENICPFSVVIVNNGAIPAAHTVHIAPAEQHLRLAGGRLWLDAAAPVCSHRPSGTVLLQSMARGLGTRALGVLLTGMGDDGAEGLSEIRRAGGYTIAEDESTAAVYGMPAAAVRLGAVCESLPLQDIAPRVLRLVPGMREAG